MVTPEEIEEEAMRRDEKADSISQYLDKQKRVKKEVTRLKRLFKEIDENKKKLVFATIDDVAFMSITMQDLRENIIVTELQWNTRMAKINTELNRVLMHSFIYSFLRNRPRQ